jgi:hypothetical protein
MEALEYRFAELRALPDDVEETRTVEFVISDETKDRHGTVLKMNGWKLDNYRKNPVVGYMHNLYGDMCSAPDPDAVIGKSEVFKDGDKLIGRVTFEPAEMNALAEKVFRKIVFGTLRTASVGFALLNGWTEEKDKKGNVINTYSDSHELLEWSVVNIPSNPSAGKREFSIQTDRALKYILNLADNKITIDELRKMTVAGVIGLVTGESVEKDREERINTDKIAKVDELERIKINRQNADIDMVLAYHDGFKKLEAEERELQQKKNKLQMEFDKIENKQKKQLLEEIERELNKNKEE